MMGVPNPFTRSVQYCVDLPDDAGVVKPMELLTMMCMLPPGHVISEQKKMDAMEPTDIVVGQTGQPKCFSDYALTCKCSVSMNLDTQDFIPDIAFLL